MDDVPPSSVHVTVNGQPRDLAPGTTVLDLLGSLHLDSHMVAVERNHEIVPRADHAKTALVQGDRVEVLTLVGGGADDDDALVIAGRRFRSRLIVGTGKYASFPLMKEALAKSGADLVTVAVRRVELDRKKDSLLNWIPEGMTLLPNTAGCTTAEEACRTARLAREMGVGNLVKLEVIGDPKTLHPDVAATIEAARVLVGEGFVVLPYTSDDVVAARRLQDAGCAAVMPLGAPIGSGLGIRNPHNIRILLEAVQVPVIVDAGVGTASDAAVAMELGCHGVLMNTGIAGARDPVRMAEAMRQAVWAGRAAFLAGRIPRKLYATASSPLDGLPG
jgi:thiazole synthase